MYFDDLAATEEEAIVCMSSGIQVRVLQMCALTVENFSERNPRAGAAFQWWLSRSYERRDVENRNKVFTWGPRVRTIFYY